MIGDILPLGEQALILRCATEAAAVRFAAGLRNASPPWLEDVVPAYASVGVYFDPEQISTRAVMDWLRAFADRGDCADLPAGRVFTVPVCYEHGPDLPRVREITGLCAEQVIAEHLRVEYTVHAIGFVPGFPYLGYLPETIQGVGRLPSPRVQVEPGSVGVTGRQTGIYPLPRPGGWHLIGQTPLILVDLAEEFFPLRVGDRIRFHRIDEHEFATLVGERLEPDHPPGHG